jgi:hypothetical protein
VHTRQDRLIQTELAFTLTKNATKSNSLKSYHYRPQGKRTIERPKKNVRENSCNSGDGTDQRVQSLMFMMMMMIMMIIRALLIYTIQCYLDDQTKKDDVVWLYDIYGKEEKSILGSPGTS